MDMRYGRVLYILLAISYFPVTGLVQSEIIGRAKHGVPLLVVGQLTKSFHLTFIITSHQAGRLSSPLLFKGENVKGAALL